MAVLTKRSANLKLMLVPLFKILVMWWMTSLGENGTRISMIAAFKNGSFAMDHWSWNQRSQRNIVVSIKIQILPNTRYGWRLTVSYTQISRLYLIIYFSDQVSTSKLAPILIAKENPKDQKNVRSTNLRASMWHFDSLCCLRSLWKWLEHWCSRLGTVSGCRGPSMETKRPKLTRYFWTNLKHTKV